MSAASPRPGFGKCGHCNEPVLYALAVTGDVIALDYDYDRVDVLAVDWDCTRTPRVREVGPSGYTRPSEHRYRMHRDSCPALAPVASLARARDLRRPARPAGPARRTASARLPVGRRAARLRLLRSSGRRPRLRPGPRPGRGRAVPRLP